MTISLVSARATAFYATDTSATRTLAGTINVGDLILAVAFGRSALTGPPGFTPISTSPVTSTATQRCALYAKTAVAADASPNPLPSITVTQASSGRMGISYAIYRSSLGAFQFTGTPATNSGTTASHTAPTVSEASSYLAFAMATNVYASGDQNDPRLASGTDVAWTLRNTNSGGDALNRLGYADAFITSGAAPTLNWESNGTSSSDEWATLTGTFLEQTAGVVKGIRPQVRLRDNSVRGDTTGISYAWWDDPAVDLETPPTPDASGAAVVSSGVAQINLNADTSLNVGNYGLLLLWKRDASVRANSIGFLGEVAIEDIS